MPLRLTPATMTLRLENISFNCLSEVFRTGLSGSSEMPSRCSRPFRKVSASKVEGAQSRCNAACATSRSGLITTSIGR
ncbi:hypothetical protein D3C76_1698030 [compost metagenome]